MYSAVPSILIVAPKGRTKLVISLETPNFSWVFFMFTGRVAALLQVVKAINMASLMPLKNFMGFMFLATEARAE